MLLLTEAANGEEPLLLKGAENKDEALLLKEAANGEEPMLLKGAATDVTLLLLTAMAAK